MNAPLLDAKINSYKQKVLKLERMAGNLSGNKKKQFEAQRKRFELRLEAWQKTLGSEMAVFNSNVAEGYRELEAQVLSARGKP